MTDEVPGDAMVPIAELLSRSEALTVAAMLDAADIIVHVGGEYYAGTTLNIVAIGGFRLTVPLSQRGSASRVLREFLTAPAAQFSRDLQRRACILMAIVGFTFVLPSGYLLFRQNELTLLTALALPFSILGTPVSPQGRGDYYLAAPEAD